MNARDYIALIRENTFLIMGSVVACLAIAGVVTLLTPKSYASSVTFYVGAGSTFEGQPDPTSDLFQGAQLAMDRVESYAELIVGPRVAQDAATALGGGRTADDVQPMLTSSSEQDTVIFTVTATDRSPDEAVAVVAAVTDSFTRLVDQLETPPGSAGPLVTAQPVQEPTPPSLSGTPSLSLNLAIGGLLGLLIGFGVAIARRSMDVSIRSAEELEDATNAAVFGAVPEAPRRGLPSTPLGIGSGPRAEAFRRVRTNLEFSSVDGNSRVLVVTSAVSGEGKTTVTCNLAAALAAVGNRVVLVEADLRRPAAANLLGLKNTVGLTTVLTGRADLNRALQTGTAGGFDVLASGQTTARPNEVLSSRQAGALIDELRSRYDFVLVDAPSILPVADAANLGTHADGAIVVCRWGKTSRHQVASAVSFLRSVSVPVVGTILSRAPAVAGAVLSHGGIYSGEQPEQEPIAEAHSKLVSTNGSPTTRKPDGDEAKPAPPDPSAETVAIRTRSTEVPPGPKQNGHGARLPDPRPGHTPQPSPTPRPTPAPRTGPGLANRTP